jgi:GNAT superfamily N-acetyltransferase
VSSLSLDAPCSVRRGRHEFATARERLDLDVIHAFLVESCWSPGIPRETVERGVRGSLAFGLYDGDAQVGFARVVTDGATFAYLADVFVLPAHRGAGLGRWLVESVLAHPALARQRRFLLATRDAHSLYARFGFVPLARPDRMMEILRPDLHRTAGG